jgi:hypothetical protein
MMCSALFFFQLYAGQFGRHFSYLGPIQGRNPQLYREVRINL